MAETNSRQIFLGLGLLGLFVLAGVMFFLRPGPPERFEQPDEQPIGLNPEEARRLVELKNIGIASLENLPNDESNDGSECIAAFTELAATLPEQPLGLRNLAITRIVIVMKQNPTMNRQRAVEALQQAEASLKALRASEGDTATLHRLAANLAKIAVEKELSSDRKRAVAEFSKAADQLPDDPIAWSELFQSASQVYDEESELIRRSALERAYELRPQNLVLLTEWLLTQAQSKDPRIVETLTQAKDVLRPFGASILKRSRGRLDMSQWIGQAAAAARANDEKGWQNVVRTVTPLVNVVKPEMAYQLDRRRLDRFVLEYAIHDFSREFYEKVNLPKPEPPSAISVKLRPADNNDQLPKLTGVHDAMLADFDLDRRLDVIVIRDNKVEVYGRDNTGGNWRIVAAVELPNGLTQVLAADLDRDYLTEQTAGKANETPNLKDRSQVGNGVTETEKRGPNNRPAKWLPADVDLVVYGLGGVRLLKNELKGELRSLVAMPQAKSFQKLNGVLAAAIVDLDQEGDLDLVFASESGISFWLNRENFTFADVTERSLLPPAGFGATSVLPVDWDRNVAVDLLLSSPSAQRAGLLENSLHAGFRWREFETAFEKTAGAKALAIIDADRNASWDLLAGGTNGISLTQTRINPNGAVRVLKSETISETAAEGMTTWDYDNDGLLDVVAWGTSGIQVLQGLPDGRFRVVADLFESPPEDVSACDVGDIDNDGDLDLLVVDAMGISWFVNEGGNKNHWIDITLNAETDPKFPNQRTNIAGIGSLLELKAGKIYQSQIVRRQKTHIGLGERDRADAVRVLFPNGIPQNVLRPKQNETIFMKQRLLIGSCPYLYTWTGEKYEFFTDCLWSSPIGLQLAEGVLAPAREWEYLKIPGEKLIAKSGEYRLQITEELWEAAYFDQVRLIAVDHPDDVEIYSNEKVGPAEIAEFKIQSVKHPRSPRTARDRSGRDILPQIAARDNVYLKAFEGRIKQGLTEEHYLELDLGKLDNPQKLTLFLTGWIFPTDTSLNVAISQNPDVDPPKPPSLWVPDADGRWREAIGYIGFPGGKTKTIAVEVPVEIFANSDYRVRIVTSMELYWDHVFFNLDEAPVEYRLQELSPAAADLHYRGFSKRIEHPGNGPESYDYDRVDPEPHWPPMQGRFTRYGDVTELVKTADDLLVVLGAGDEMTLRFKVPSEAPPAGWKRDFLLYNIGWDKDANLNTVYGQTVEPLPFRGMTGYPYAPGETYPETPRHRKYLETYQTRRQNLAKFWHWLRRFDASE